ncbi:Dolichol-phosphate mannosyltransferase subunit 3 family-containing protein [Strongyloides ratti]|uniref:Dolichol-phosphate mannosyltransferase subunit 3 n=1 Tax=Strongyloides ratti TaxID=34506 RepID=A0A090N0T0_STRRB|nr:Dolichol-phosphate mannosyltransferase subunit 3 family-containing protein [Strongyloides ratti]CEF71223.1 Dolichol-phosphate mannosyltransferase subunit 3 family-containing protein [Strongyloides ratti]
MATQLALSSCVLFPLLLCWIGLLNEWIPLINQNLPQIIVKNLKYAPLYVIFIFTLYALTSLFIGVVTFSDCKEAKIELMNEVNQAKEELRKR